MALKFSLSGPRSVCNDLPTPIVIVTPMAQQIWDQAITGPLDEEKIIGQRPLIESALKVGFKLYVRKNFLITHCNV